MLKTHSLNRLLTSVSSFRNCNGLHLSSILRDSGDGEFPPTYENKNPRNLEWSGHQKKRFGWNLQFPPKDFYHQVYLKVRPKNLKAVVEHSSGRTIIQISSEDAIIRQYLHSARDMSAAMNLGRIVADRCIQYGIDQLKYLKDLSGIDSAKEEIFREALIKGGLKLEEPEFIERPDSSLGLDYDNVDFFQEKRTVEFPPKINRLISENLRKKSL